MSKRKTLLAILIPLLILVGVITFKLWAGEEILPGPAPDAVATATPAEVTPGAVVTFDGSGSEDEDTLVTWEERNGKKYNYKEVEIAGKVLTWTWSFGDGGSGSGKTVAHTYKKKVSRPVTYTAKLTITADHGETASTTVAVTVNPKCWDKQLAYGEALRAEAIAYQEMVKTQQKWQKIEDERRDAREYMLAGIAAYSLCILAIPPGVPDCEEYAEIVEKATKKYEAIVQSAKNAEKEFRKKGKEYKEATKRKKEAYEAWKKCLKESQ